MHAESKLGLYRLMDEAQKERVERELTVSFADLFASLDDARDLIRELERTMDAIFQGEHSDCCR